MPIFFCKIDEICLPFADTIYDVLFPVFSLAALNAIADYTIQKEQRIHEFVTSIISGVSIFA